MPDDGQSCTETVAFYNTLGCPLSKADRGPTKTLSSFIQDLQPSSLVNPPASPRAGTKPWLTQVTITDKLRNLNHDMAVSDLQSDSDLDSIRYSCDSGPLKLTFSAKIDIESPKCTAGGGSPV